MSDEADPVRYVQRLRDWGDAYPTDVFPVPPEDKQARDGAAAHVMRVMAVPHFLHAADFIEELAATTGRYRLALEQAEKLLPVNHDAAVLIRAALAPLAPSPSPYPPEEP